MGATHSQLQEKTARFCEEYLFMDFQELTQGTDKRDLTIGLHAVPR